MAWGVALACAAAADKKFFSAADSHTLQGAHYTHFGVSEGGRFSFKSLYGF